MHLITTKPMIKTKFKELLSELKKFKDSTIKRFIYNISLRVQEKMILKSSIQMLN